jgi:hypothetical protein
MPTPVDPHQSADPALPCILVVEDEPVIRELMAILWKRKAMRSVRPATGWRRCRRSISIRSIWCSRM